MSLLPVLFLKVFIALSGVNLIGFVVLFFLAITKTIDKLIYMSIMEEHVLLND